MRDQWRSQSDESIQYRRRTALKGVGQLPGMIARKKTPMNVPVEAMERFRRMKTLRKFASVHGSVHNPFKQERHLVSRDIYRERRSAALAEWRAVAA